MSKKIRKKSSKPATANTVPATTAGRVKTPRNRSIAFVGSERKA